MNRLALAALLVATPVAAQPCRDVLALPGAVERQIQWSDDLLALAPAGSGRMLLCYWNAETHTSQPGPYEITLNGATVAVSVEVGDRETISVTPPDGWFVWPADDAERELADGAEVVIELIGGTS